MGWLTVTLGGGSGADSCFCVQPAGKSRIKPINAAAALFFIRAKVAGAALKKGRALPRCLRSKKSHEKNMELATEIIVSPDAESVSPDAESVSPDLAAGLYQSGLRISDRLPGKGMYKVGESRLPQLVRLAIISFI